MGLDLSSKRHFPEDNPVVKAFPSSKRYLPEDKPGVKALPSSKQARSEDKKTGRDSPPVIVNCSRKNYFTRSP